VRWNKKPSIKSDKTETSRTPKRGVVGYSRKSALLEEAITQMNAGKYGRSSAALKELLALDPVNMEARRLFATLHLRLGSLIPAREAFDALLTEAFHRQDYWLAESLLREYLAAGPRCVPYLEKLGTIYQEKGNVLEAVEEYGKAVDILIEDPDPEQPDHADRLYSKIRELAPASPVAFRLASFFDAETGRLIPRQPSVFDTDTARQEDVLEEDAREQLAPTEADGAMPREGQAPPAVMGPSDETPHSAEGAQPDAHAVHSVGSPEQARSEEEAAVQVESSGIEAPVNHQAECATQTTGEAPVAEETGQFPAQDLVGESLPTPGSGDLRVEPLVAPLEAPRNRADTDSLDLQIPKPDSSESLETTPTLEDRPVSKTMRFDSEQTADSSVGFSAAIVEPGLSSQSQADNEPPPPSLRTEQADPEPVPVPHKGEATLTTGKAERPQVEERAGSTDSPRDSAPVSADETAQPWKQPGFSWKSVFDTAWKFGEQSPIKDASTSPVPTPVDTSGADTPPLSSPQEQRIEDSAGEPLKLKEASLKITEEASSPSVAPMPLGQVQESMLSIQSIQADAPSAAPIYPLVDQSQDQDSTSRACDSHLQPAARLNGPDPDPASFSFAQDVPPVHPEDRHDAVVETDAPSSTDQGAEQIAESAPLFSIVRSSPADEVVSPASQGHESQPCTQDVGPRLSVDQQEVRGESAEFSIKQEQPHSGAATEEVEPHPKAESQLQHSQSVDEVVSENIEIVGHNESVPIEQSVTKSVTDVGDEALLEHQEASHTSLQDNQPPEIASSVHTESPISEPTSSPQERIEADVVTRVNSDSAVSPVTPAESVISATKEVSQPLPAVHVTNEASAESSRMRKAPETRARIEEPTPRRPSPEALNGVAKTIIVFLRSCFSTTQAIVKTVVGLVMLLGMSVALSLGALALIWMIMEEPPSPTFQSFTTTPQQTLSEVRKNAYMLLMGIDAPVEQDPFHAGGERQAVIGDRATASSCFGAVGPETSDQSSASASTIRGWVRGSDPIGQFKSHQETIQGWGNRHQAALERYRQWKKLPFEDWGYGQPVSPPCGAMVFTHQLHVADGFVQGMDAGVDRLETDMEMWRVVLSQARTLPVKVLALQAINDDIGLASDLLVRSDFDTKHLGRITKFVRPLDREELSLRWPMQSELVSAGKTYERQVKAARADGQAISAMVASILPLPKQRRLNDYAKYYEASHQAAGEKQYSSLPKWKDHVRFPAAGVMDYLADPIENLVGVEPLPAWDLYSGMVVDTDAHLRLASLQAWLRRGSSEGDLPSKIAKAGQDFYDPYTGLPMLVNQKKGLLYSVGHDGKDQDADLHVDVVVEIPEASHSASQDKSSTASSKPR